MTCTMRQWHISYNESTSSLTSRQSDSSSEPEIILTRIEMVSILSKRSESLTRLQQTSDSSLRVSKSNSFSKQETKPQPPVHIPLSDIKAVEIIEPSSLTKKTSQEQSRCIASISPSQPCLGTNHCGGPFIWWPIVSFNSIHIFYRFARCWSIDRRKNARGFGARTMVRQADPQTSTYLQKFFEHEQHD